MLLFEKTLHFSVRAKRNAVARCGMRIIVENAHSQVKRNANAHSAASRLKKALGNRKTIGFLENNNMKNDSTNLAVIIPVMSQNTDGGRAASVAARRAGYPVVV